RQQNSSILSETPRRNQIDNTSKTNRKYLGTSKPTKCDVKSKTHSRTLQYSIGSPVQREGTTGLAPIESRSKDDIQEVGNAIHRFIRNRKIRGDCTICHTVTIPKAEFVNAFTRKWNYELAWIFPPPPLIPRVLQHLDRCRGTFILIVPRWEKAFWRPALKKRATDPPLIIANLQEHLLDLQTTGRRQGADNLLYIWRHGKHGVGINVKKMVGERDQAIKGVLVKFEPKNIPDGMENLVSRHFAILLRLSPGRRVHDLTLLRIDEGYFEQSEEQVIFWPQYGSKTDGPSNRQSGWKLKRNADSLWDVVTCLANYRQVSGVRRSSNNSFISTLFVTTRGRTGPTSRSVIAGRVRTALLAAGIENAAGGARSAVATSRLNESLPLDEVLKKGNWRGSSNHFKHYYKEVKSTPDVVVKRAMYFKCKLAGHIASHCPSASNTTSTSNSKRQDKQQKTLARQSHQNNEHAPKETTTSLTISRRIDEAKSQETLNVSQATQEASSAAFTNNQTPTIEKNLTKDPSQTFYHLQQKIPKYNTRYQIPDTRYQIPDIRFQIPDTRYQIPDTRYQTPDTRHQIPDTRHQTPDTRYQKNEKRKTKMKNEKFIKDNRYQIPDTTYQTPDTRFQISDSRFQIPDTRYQIPDTRHQIPDTRHQTPDTRYQTRFQIPDTRHQTPDTRYQIPDTRYQIPDSRFQILDTRYQIPDTRYQISDIRYQIPDTRYQIPDTRYQIPDTRYQIPDTIFQIQLSDSRYQIPDSRFQIPDTRYQAPDTRRQIPDTSYQIPDTRYPIPDSRYQIPDTRFQIPDTRYQIPDTRFQIPDSRYQIPDTRFQIPDIRFQIPDTRYQIPDTRFQIPDTRYQIPDTRHQTPDTRF
ncbi:unnamed protein product, partial [Acanthoscelides obtectus]